MADQSIYFYEFLYRGRPSGSIEEPAWHVVLAADSVDAFGAKSHTERTLNMVQAQEAGWALPQILSAINADILAQNTLLAKQVEELTEEDNKLLYQIKALQVELNSLKASMATEEIDNPDIMTNTKTSGFWATISKTLLNLS